MDDKIMKLQAQITSSETIKPSTPTPIHLKTFNLSLLDQIFPAFHIPLLLFYAKRTTATPPPPIHTLKTSLSQTLSKFYPLSGRCIDDSTVSCNDEGVPFIETLVNSSLSDVLDSTHKLHVLTKFLPPRDLLALGPRPISELVPLAFQVNVFACGGVVIGCYMLHKLLDAASLGIFFKHWAAIVSGRHQDVVEPDFTASFKAFPPSPSIEGVLVPDLCKDQSSDLPPLIVSVKSFRLTRAAITNLKALAATEAVPNPTSFETVAGFVWQNAVVAARQPKDETVSDITNTTLSISTNMRLRTNPPLPRESMGNCVTHVQAKATKQSTLRELVEEIHGAVSRATTKIEAYQGENGMEGICADRKEASRFVMEDNPCVYQLSSWCKLGLDEADFGFGKPNWIIPTDGIVPPSLRNLIFFTDYCDSNSDGIEVWLFLEESEMQILEANTQFLDFVSPN